MRHKEQITFALRNGVGLDSHPGSDAMQKQRLVPPEPLQVVQQKLDFPGPPARRRVFHEGENQVLEGIRGLPPKKPFQILLPSFAQLAKRIEAKIKDMLGFRINISLVAPNFIARSEGKSKRVFDNR